MNLDPLLLGTYVLHMFGALKAKICDSSNEVAYEAAMWRLLHTKSALPLTPTTNQTHIVCMAV